MITRVQTVPLCHLVKLIVRGPNGCGRRRIGRQQRRLGRSRLECRSRPDRALVAVAARLRARHSSMVSFTGIFDGSFHSAPSEQMVMSNRIPRTSTYEYGKLGGLNTPI